MFHFLKALFRPKPEPWRSLVDFSDPRPNHWANYNGGTNFEAHFTIRGQVALGDEILVGMSSGRVGRYRLYSVRPDFVDGADWKAQGMAIGYWGGMPTTTRPRPIAEPEIKGLLGDGSRWVRSDKGELAHLPSGFTKPTSDFWKILCRDEACHQGTDRMRATSDL
jgi:hypothetical protein